MTMIMITRKTVKNRYIQGTSPTNNIIKIMFSSKINSQAFHRKCGNKGIW